MARVSIARPMRISCCRSAAAKIERAGTQVTIVAYSIMVGVALAAAQKLAADGIDAEVINLRTLRPLDIGTVVESVKKTGRVITVEEGWALCRHRFGNHHAGDRTCVRLA